MIGSNSKKPKDRIIEILFNNPLSGKQLQEKLAEQGHKVSIQIIYQQLNTLIELGVILKNKKKYSISNEWIKELSDMLSIQDIDLPEEGEKFTYKFNSLQKLDSHWKHATESFNKILGNEPMFLYSYHQFWIYTPTREQSEKKFAGEFRNKKQYTFYVIGGVTELDKKYRNNFKDEYYKVENFSIKSLKEKDHVLVIGDYIINVRVPELITKKIDNIYKLNESIKNKEVKLRELLKESHKSMFTIEKNTKKSKIIKKRISQPFIIPQEIKKQIV